MSFDIIILVLLALYPLTNSNRLSFLSTHSQIRQLHSLILSMGLVVDDDFSNDLHLIPTPKLGDKDIWKGLERLENEIRQTIVKLSLDMPDDDQQDWLRLADYLDNFFGFRLSFHLYVTAIVQQSFARASECNDDCKHYLEELEKFDDEMLHCGMIMMKLK